MPSTIRIGGVPAVRVAIVNHRTTAADADALADAALERLRPERTFVVRSS